MTEMNGGPTSSDQLLPSHLANLNWEQCLHPLTSVPPSPIFDEISSFRGSPLNSLHVNRLMPFSTDPGFAERAARYSSFSSGNCGSFLVQLDIPESGKVSTVSSCHSLIAKENPAQSRAQWEMGDGEFTSGREDSSVTDQTSAPGESNSKKRKAAPRKKVKVVNLELRDLNAKNFRSSETAGTENDGGAPKEDPMKLGDDNGSKAPEPYKDYIHVRARRGQATDSHSLAERVRREKISQRMKLLQDLVPGCNKITGKALMLDEIINYVQSLQRQVEFLSMRLATVNPRFDFNLENLISKESLLNQASGFANSLFPLENLAAATPFGQQTKEARILPFAVANGMDTNCSIGPLDSTLHQAAIMLPSSLDMLEGSSSQVKNLWDDELHGVLQTGLWPNQ